MAPFDITGTQDPWVVFGRRDSATIAGQLDTFASAGGRIHHFQGKALRDEQALFQEFATELAFPGYFGRNWDAMVDCLDDLCGAVTGGIGLAGVIEGAATIVDVPFLRTFVSVLCQGAARANSAVDLDGDPLDRAAIAQHFVFLLDEHPSEGLATRLEHPDLVVALDDQFLTVTLDPEAWYS